ncbi:succinate-semialdehyde dehydrogenase [Kocuria rosea]|uniref:NAD-dependent succinate-semialdehyde dehydrogenase n=2 Tax=Kocuria rosea TaxID=1275 RepID=UPI000D65A399|nr:NAD-dependent succinate-semialdehyde dehydrogenase [Kocuria rosea]MEB2617504.1 NAD-dependent succinate-semialdehyde dehydrogenase [Kocuria rosea]PWF87101.1 succinate-semialdehyde dehydrogenase [Kocuria rosea]QCY34104.1 NAD-dependent succinate-semialdehyde dehydrogenase [Kocuria rosea]TQN38319.1 succinate-semialdehyde dehydrogenase/glutarate-semialdehyde dehydrogenase [Kocuria rosea]VEI50948.1 Succinate semialdehyde dehydrogenase [NAD(P)+] Sad [Kocuria rosea]
MTADARSTAPSAYRSVNPATGRVLAEHPTATDAQVQEALAGADAAFRAWRTLPIEERAAVAARVGTLFAERVEELAAVITEEMGKPLAEARDEVAFCAEIFGYFAEQGPALAADQPITASGGGRAVVQKRPVGVLLGIMPWNYPYYQVARFAAPNLVLGNTILLKHAESCPRAALALQQLMDDAGVPAGAYANVFASHDQVADIIADPRVQGVSLTGSERAGAKVAEIAGRNLKKVVLELGGSDPYVVLDTDDVRESARAAFATRMGNTGQACNSNKRMIVMADLYDEFVAELTRQAEALTPGDPAEAAPGTFAPLSSRAAAEGLARQIRAAVDAGATLNAGGRLLEGPGAYLEPTVLTGITPDMAAHHEELFGPVAVVYRVADDAEALALANDTPYGLGGAVFSTDPERARRLAEGLDAGMAAVNAAEAEGAEMPFGGVKRSGYGRELGPLGMDEFVNKRLLYVKDRPAGEG